MKPVKVKGTVIGEGIPKICVSIIGKTESDIIKEADCIKELNADIIEWRVDFFENAADINSVIDALKKIRIIFNDKPIIFTWRSAKEGGQKEISSPYYVKLNETVAKSKLADIIDIELFTKEEDTKGIVRIAHENNIFVIISNHDFDKTPPREQIIWRMQKEQELGADILKIAVMSHSAADVLALMSAASIMKEKYSEHPLIAIAMGTKGVISRISGEIFGSDISFGAAKNPSAPGQIYVADLRSALKLIHNNSNEE